MIILESESPSRPAPPSDKPPSYSGHEQLAGRSQQPRFPPTLSPPPAMVSVGSNRSIPSPMTPREEALIGHEYQLQLLARCAQGNHEEKRHFGVVGIIFAVILFPVGFICLAIDSRRNCSRCGVRLE